MSTLRMTKRSRAGAGSRQFHDVPAGRSPYRNALCGTKPVGYTRTNGKPGVGSGWSNKAGSAVTCPKCLNKARGARP